MQSLQRKSSKILIFQRILPEYRVSVFRELYKRLGCILCHGYIRKSSLKQTDADFPHEKTFSFFFKKHQSLGLQDVLSPIFKHRPDIVITEFYPIALSCWMLLIFRLLLKYKLVLWSHGYNRKKGFQPKKSYIDRLRIWWMEKADAVLFYGQQGKDIISKFINPEKLFVAQNTLDTSKLLRIRGKLEKEGKESVKQRIGFHQKYNIIFIGRILKSKLAEKVLGIYIKIKKRINDIALHYVGDGSMLALLKRIVDQNAIENVFFHGSIYDDESTGEMLYSSDIMIMPSCLGLSVNHALCFDTPIFSQKAAGHGPEVEYVVNEKTGFLVDKGDFDYMVELICSYLEDEKMQDEIIQNIRYMVQNVCSIDKMISGFEDAIFYCRK